MKMTILSKSRLSADLASPIITVGSRTGSRRHTSRYARQMHATDRRINIFQEARGLIDLLVGEAMCEALVETIEGDG
jgi:hypothetical protein